MQDRASSDASPRYGTQAKIALLMVDCGQFLPELPGHEYLAGTAQTVLTGGTLFWIYHQKSMLSPHLFHRCLSDRTRNVPPTFW
jgi:hypothetical protein